MVREGCYEMSTSDKLMDKRNILEMVGRRVNPNEFPEVDESDEDNYDLIRKLGAYFGYRD